MGRYLPRQGTHLERDKLVESPNNNNDMFYHFPALGIAHGCQDLRNLWQLCVGLYEAGAANNGNVELESMCKPLACTRAVRMNEVNRECADQWPMLP